MKNFNLLKQFILLNTILFSFNSQALGLEPKEINNVVIENLITETQETSPSDSDSSLIWWIPYEFWEASLEQSTSIEPALKESILQIVEPYFMLIVIQKDNSSSGNSYSLEQVKQNLTFNFENSSGEEQKLIPLDNIPSDLVLLQEAIRSAVKQRVNNIGENFHILVFENTTSEGDLLISPYETGIINVTLSENNNVATSNLAIDLPLNSLYVPRICPNGKEAHVSWQYCPWDGSELEE